MKLHTLQIMQILLKMTLAGSWSVISGAHIQAFTFFHGVHTLKITVGCPTRTYPSIRTKKKKKLALTLSRSQSVARRGRIQAFTFLLVKALSRSRSAARRTRVQALGQKLARVLDSLVRSAQKRGEILKHHKSPPNTV